MLRAAATAERAGVPSVSIVTTAFRAQAVVVSKGVGMPELPIAEYPGVPMTDGSDAVRAKIEKLTDQIIDGLVRPVASAAAGWNEPASRDIVFRGSLDAVQHFFHERLWSDGLPVIPPTIERVERFLAFTDRAPDDVLGHLLPENRAATVWSVAVNGVMAGCRPEYMPLLIAIVEAIAEPRFRVEDAGSTPGWESLVIVSGPAARQLDFNAGQGVMRVGRQANTSVGRFLRLYLRNIAGLRIPPGAGDKGSIAGSFHVALAEDEDAATQMGWPTFGTDQGFSRDESAVTVQSVVAVSPPIYSAGTRGIDHVKILAEAFEQTSLFWSNTALKYAVWYPLLVIGPSIAGVIAGDGWTKDDVRAYFHDHVRVRASDVERYAWNVGSTAFSLEAQVKDGVLPAEYTASGDPDRTVPVLVKPELIGIVVAGDAGRNQSKGYVNNHIQGGRVSKRVVFRR